MTPNRQESINKVMESFYSIDGITLEKAKIIIKSIEEDLIAEYQGICHKDGDYRLGNDSYGYKEGEEGILCHLFYISDRWRCAFRIAWILGLVNEDYI